MTAVYACVRFLPEAVAGLPFYLHKWCDSGSKEKAVDHPLYFLLYDEPNKEMTSFIFRETLMTHLLLWGSAYAQIIRNGKGEVTALCPLMPNKMTVDIDRNGELFYQYTLKVETSTLSIAFGDISNYWIGDSGARTVQRLNELYATNG